MKTITTNLRDIPETLHQTIKELAEKEKRSWNSQALILLEKGLLAVGFSDKLKPEANP